MKSATPKLFVATASQPAENIKHYFISSEKNTAGNFTTLTDAFVLA
jgi:hypothetical protein